MTLTTSPMAIQRTTAKREEKLAALIVEMKKEIAALRGQERVW